MSIASTLYSIGNALDPMTAYWSAALSTGKRVSERTLLPTLARGGKGLRSLDWALDLVSTGDVRRITELSLHCPDGRTAVLEIAEPGTAFQFKTKSLTMFAKDGLCIEYQVIGRVVDKATGRCEAFAWDYRPKPGEPNLVAFKTSIYNFGSWRDTMTPIGALGLEVQGFKL